MNQRVRILLALLGCLVFGANALGAIPGHCDPVCCAEPCEPGPLAPPPDCTCCSVRSTTDTDPMLPSLTSAPPLPAELPALPHLLGIEFASHIPIPTPPPAPAPPPVRAAVLLI